MKIHSNYRNEPGGLRLNSNTCGEMRPVALEDLIANGSRTQRRWALKELRKLERKNSWRAAS